MAINSKAEDVMMKKLSMAERIGQYLSKEEFLAYQVVSSLMPESKEMPMEKADRLYDKAVRRIESVNKKRARAAFAIKIADAAENDKVPVEAQAPIIGFVTPKATETQKIELTGENGGPVKSVQMSTDEFREAALSVLDKI